jgi:hypothetical protein
VTGLCAFRAPLRNLCAVDVVPMLAFHMLETPAGTWRDFVSNLSTGGASHEVLVDFKTLSAVSVLLDEGASRSLQRVRLWPAFGREIDITLAESHYTILISHRRFQLHREGCVCKV